MGGAYFAWVGAVRLCAGREHFLVTGLMSARDSTAQFVVTVHDALESGFAIFGASQNGGVKGLFPWLGSVGTAQLNAVPDGFSP